LTPEQFAARFEESRRTLWFIAAAILGDRTQAHDVVQEAASIGIGKLDEFDPQTSFTAWMGQIVRFVALNDARRRSRQKASLAELGAGTSGTGRGVGQQGGSGWGLAGTGTDELFDARVAAELRALEETARACLVLRVVRGLSYREISRALDIPEGTAMSHVHRARQAMRSRLGGTGPDGRGE